MSDVALATTALVLVITGVALQLRPAEALALYTQQAHQRPATLLLDLARLAGWGAFGLGVVALVLLGVRHAETRAAICYALAYVFFFAAAMQVLQSYVDHGSWIVALARSPVEPIAVLYTRLYAPIALSLLNFIAAWCDDVEPPLADKPDQSEKKLA